MEEFFPEFDKDTKECILNMIGVDLPNSLNPQDADHLIKTIFLKSGKYNMKESENIDFINKVKHAYQNYLKSTFIFISDENEFPGTRRFGFIGSQLFSMYEEYDNIFFFAIHDDGSVHTGELIPKNKDIKAPKDIDKISNIFLNGDDDWKISYNNLPNFQNDSFWRNNEIFEVMKFYDEQKIYCVIDIIISNTRKEKVKQITKIVSHSLNQDIRDIINKTDIDNISFAKWLTGGDGALPNVILSRQQALLSYPVFARDIWNRREIRDIVEQKQPLAPALAKKYNVDEKRLKRVQGKSIENIRIKNKDYKVKDIFNLKEHHFQQLKDNLSDLIILRDYGDYIYNMSLHEFMDYLSLRGANPCQHIKRMKESLIHNVFDARDFLLKKLFIPAFLNRIKNHAQKNNLTWHHQDEYWYINKELLVKHTNIKTLLDFSERYHRNLFRWEDMFTFDSGMKHISWQPMFAEIDLGNGWIAREIDSVALLKEQGEKENHCVGGYAGSILERDDDSARLIFSLEKNGEIKSTIDMLCSKNEEKNGLDVKVQQNRAHSNKDPNAEALNFSHHLFEIIKKQPISKLNTYLQNLRPVREKYESYQTKNKYLSRCGYDPWNRDILENIWNEFKPALPTKLRRLGLDGFIDIIPVNKDYFYPRKEGDILNPWDVMKNKNLVQIERDEDDAEMVI